MRRRVAWELVVGIALVAALVAALVVGLVLEHRQVARCEDAGGEWTTVNCHLVQSDECYLTVDGGMLCYPSRREECDHACIGAKPEYEP